MEIDPDCMLVEGTAFAADAWFTNTKQHETLSALDRLNMSRAAFREAHLAFKAQRKLERGMKGPGRATGVSYVKRQGRWRTQFQHKGVYYQLGQFNTQRDAMQAHDEYVRDAGIDRPLYNPNDRKWDESSAATGTAFAIAVDEEGKGHEAPAAELEGELNPEFETPCGEAKGVVPGMSDQAQGTGMAEVVDQETLPNSLPSSYDDDNGK